jgi:hypothetical protein
MGVAFWSERWGAGRVVCVVCVGLGPGAGRSVRARVADHVDGAWVWLVQSEGPGGWYVPRPAAPRGNLSGRIRPAGPLRSPVPSRFRCSVAHEVPKNVPGGTRSPPSPRTAAGPGPARAGRPHRHGCLRRPPRDPRGLRGLAGPMRWMRSPRGRQERGASPGSGGSLAWPVPAAGCRHSGRATPTASHVTWDAVLLR